MKEISSHNVQNVGIDSSLVMSDKATYKDGDVLIFDNVNDLSQIYIGDEHSEIRPDMNIIAYCLTGRLMFDINGQSVTVNEGHAVICPPKALLSNYMMSPNFKCVIFCFTTHILQESLRGYISQWNHWLYVKKVNIIEMIPEDSKLIQCYYDLLLCKIGHPVTEFYQRIMQSIIQAVLFEICGRMKNEGEDTVNTTPRAASPRNASPQSNTGNTLFNSFLDMLNNEPQKRHPVEYYAGKLFVTPKHLSVVCKRETGKSALDWIMEYELEEVRFYLTDTSLSVKEAAEKCGFTNLSFFGRFVRDHFGCSPRAFRQKLICT